jgi:hypothetical protein
MFNIKKVNVISVLLVGTNDWLPYQLRDELCDCGLRNTIATSSDHLHGVLAITSPTMIAIVEPHRSEDMDRLRRKLNGLMDRDTSSLMLIADLKSRDINSTVKGFDMVIDLSTPVRLIYRRIARLAALMRTRHRKH